MNLNAKTAAIFSNIYALKVMTEIRRFVLSADTKKPIYYCPHSSNTRKGENMASLSSCSPSGGFS
jgi:hypothetical protein